MKKIDCKSLGSYIDERVQERKVNQTRQSLTPKKQTTLYKLIKVFIGKLDGELCSIKDEKVEQM